MRKDVRYCRGSQVSAYTRNIIFVFLILSALLLPALAQEKTDEIQFEHLCVKDGLPQSTIFCIHKDKRGFMWFGTQHGLSRYDGHDFKLYDYNYKDEESLSQNYVTSITEDQEGILWVGTQGGGINRFDPKTEKFERYIVDAFSISCNNVNTIFCDRDNILWIGTDLGLYRFNRSEKRCKRCELKQDKTKGEKINTIYQDRSKSLWVGTEAGLFRCDMKNNTFMEIECKVLTQEPKLEKIRAIYEDNSNNIFWVGTEAGLYNFKLDGSKFTQDKKFNEKTEKLTKAQVTTIHRDTAGRLWVGTIGDGLYILDPKLDEFISCNNKTGDSSYRLSHDEVISLYEDPISKLVWIGTNGGGVNIFDPFRQKFDLYDDIPGSNDIMAICKSKDGGIWLGTFGGGISKFNPEKKEIEGNYKIPKKISEENPNRDRINAVCESRNDGKVWVGTNGAGLYEFTPASGIFVRYEDKNIKKDEKISEITAGHDGVLWIGTLGSGLVCLDKERKNSTAYTSNPKNEKSLSDDAIYSICEDRNHMLWIGTRSGGLNRFDRKSKTFKRFQPDKESVNCISHNFVTVIHEDTSGALWIGTSGGGLNKIDSNKKNEVTFTVFTTKDGLPNNVIYGILEDKEGFLWLSTNKGLSRFNPKLKTAKNYSTRDGLQGYEFNNRIACKVEKDEKEIMFFGGIKGLNGFNPVEVKLKERRNIQPPVVVTSFKKYNKEVQLPISISEMNELDLTYKDKSVTFEFAALSFADPGSNQYAYKLEPVDKDWIDLGNKHNIDLINLKPRDYTFRVKGSNNDGVWNDKGTSIKINVTPPFTQTLYFYILLVLMISSLIFGFSKWRINIIKKANQKLELEVEQRKKAEELYKKLVETSPDAITLSDVETKKIVLANQQTAVLLGYKNVEELQKKVTNIFDAFSPNDRSRAKKNALQIKDSGFNKSSEYALLSKDGTFIDVEMSTSLIRDTDQKPKYFLSITRDIRTRKEEERKKKLEQERLVQIDKMVSLGTLVSGVAHELNNPLSSIKMNADSFSKVWQDVVPVLDQHYERNRDYSMAKVPYELSKPRFQDLITGLIESGLRIEKIINTLKDFSRPGDASAKQPIDINKVIKSSIKLINNIIGQSTNNFSFKPAGNLPKLEGNFQRLEQVFINLIQNSCQALADKTKKIEIETIYRSRDKKIEVRIEDEGKGISEKDKKYIMELFYTTRRESGGTGLGLAISTQIVGEHGGKLNVESEVGRGTIVTIKLPVIEVQ